jgi:hypothetical protein
MFAYRIDLLDSVGAVAASHFGVFRTDVAAADHATWLDHSDGLRISQGGRLVASFPPLPPSRLKRRGEPKMSEADRQLLRAAMVAARAELACSG